MLMLALDDESKSQFLLKSQKQCFLPSCVSVYLRTSALTISAPCDQAGESGYEGKRKARQAPTFTFKNKCTICGKRRWN